MNVAATAVGGGVGQTIIKALQDTEYRVVGIDGEVLGTGLYAVDKGYLGYYANHPKFIERIIEICEKEKCRVLFPGLDVELLPLSNNLETLERNDVVPIVSNPGVIKICDDKLETARFLQKNGFPSAKTYRLTDYTFDLDFPVILKPQEGGRRSIGRFVANDRREFDRYCEVIDVNNYVVQEYIQGDEYTCGTVSLENRCVGVILMKRDLRDGDTYKAFVVKDQTLSNFVTSVINALGPFGACNVQLVMKEDVPYIFEVNARCSGTTACRALAGFNEPKMICDYVSKGIKDPSFTIREIAILRYWQEFVVSYEKIREMKSNKSVHNEGVRF
jgi:carbamoyl-phosphate synthase large subunit